MSKKSKFLKTLTIFGTALCAPLLLSGCTQAENPENFRVQDGWVQYTKDCETWTNLIKAEDVKTYTVTYDYGITADYFQTAPQTSTVEEMKWLTDLPEIKNECKNSFLGWFVEGSDKQITNYDFIGGDVTLIPRFNLSGLYQNGKYIKTWKDLIDDEIVVVEDGLFSYRGFTISGELIIDDSVEIITNDAFLGCSGLTSVTIPSSVTTIGDLVFWDCENLTEFTLQAKDGHKWQVKHNITGLWIDCNTLTADEILGYATAGCKFQQVEI